MSIFTPTGGSAPSSVSSSTPDLVLGTPSSARLMLPLTPGTEDSYTFPIATKYFRIRARDNARLAIAFSSGATSTIGLTVYPGVVWGPPAILNLTSSLTIWFASSKASSVIEIEIWS